MPRRGSRAVASAAAAVVLATAGCTGGSDDRTARGVVIGISEPRSLLPTDTVDTSGVQVLSALFHPLVTVDAGAPVPAAAESVTPDRSARVWTVRLRPGAGFHNGEPVTADNYIAAWNYGAYGPNGQSGASSFARIDGYADLQSRDPDGPDGPERAPAPAATALRGLKKVDDTTFTVTLSGPFAGWASLLDGPAFYPLPRAAFRAPGEIADGFAREPVGNGPFRMTGPRGDDPEIRMTRAPGFVGTPPGIEAVTWKFYRDPGDAYADLVAGDLDVQPAIPAGRLADAREDLGDRLRTSADSTLTFLALPVLRPEFAKPDVRRALSLAIDRPRLAGRAAEAPATAFVPPVVPGHRPDACPDCGYDPARARTLYAAAGGPPAITIAFHTDAGHGDVIEEICRQVTAAVGAGCAAAGRDTVADLLVTAGDRRSGDLTRMSWTMNYPLMESYLAPVYGTGGAANVHGYSNPAFDSLVAQGSAATTPAGAVAKWQEAEDVLARDMPVIPLFFGQNTYGHSKRVTNVAIDPARRLDLLRIQIV
jgi:ABC-type transport system substrate-binding protein